MKKIRLFLILSLAVIANNNFAQTIALDSTQNASCFGMSDGYIAVSVSGGLTPYTYAWSSGQTTEDITGIVAGTYTLTIEDALTVTDIQSFTVTEPSAITVDPGNDAFICKGDNAQLNGQVFSASGTGKWSTLGDGSFIPNDSSLTAIYEPGDSDTTSGSVIIILVSTNTGVCPTEEDSITLTLNPTYSTPVTAMICDNDSIMLQGAYQSSPGTYMDTLSSVDGCDSVIVTTLTVNSTYSTPVSAMICDNDSIMLQGAFQTTAGTYMDTLASVDGCDSIIVTTLTINPTYEITTNVTICTGDSTLVFGTYQTAAGTYYDSLMTVDGCDSVNIVNLMVDPPLTSSSVAVSICAGESYFAGGANQTTAGSYIDTLVSINGCDSVVKTTNLTITALPVVTASAANDTICQGASVLLTASATGGGAGAATYLWNNAGLLSSATVFNPTATPTATPTVFTVTVTKASCSASASVTITLNSAPTVSIAQVQNTTACLDTITITAPTAVSYTWVTPSGIQTTSSNQIIVLMSNSAQTYTVTAFDALGCNTSNTFSVPGGLSCEPIGIDELSEGAIAVYPNPNNGSFNVSVKNDLTSDIVLFDITGKTVYQNAFKSTLIPVDLNLLPGIYFLQVTNNGQSAIEKVIIK